VQVLREEIDADAELAARGMEDNDAQRERNVLWETSVDRVAALLADLRTNRMGTRGSKSRPERQAAERLLEWYGWETSDSFLPGYLIPVDPPPIRSRVEEPPI
jgi:hypothetical protein